METNSKNLPNQTAGEPVAPLPNPGEGGPVGPMPNRPIIPLPNPGEGGPVGPMPNRPIIPLPNPGEGGPVGPMPNRPIIPLPNPGEGGPVGEMPNKPIIPLPNPGEGGPVFPGLIGTIITTYPRPNGPCKFCVSPNKYGTIRFLNAASDYNPFSVYVNENLFVTPFGFSEMTEYEKVASGNQMITVMGNDGYIYIQKPVMIPEKGVATIAIINTPTGIDLEVISDIPCNRPYYVSCIRACNLSPNSGPLNVVIGDDYVTFMNLNYKEVADYKTIWPGEYNYFVSRSSGNAYQPNNRGTILLTSMLAVQNNVNYTMYLFNWNRNSPDAIKVLIVEERM